MTVQRYITEHIQDIVFEQPFFYNHPFGIRFELGPPDFDVDEATYYRVIRERVLALFHAIFRADQPLYIVGATYEPIDDSTDYMERAIPFQHYFDKQQLELLQRVEVLDEVTQELSGYNMHYAVQCLVSDVDIEELLGLMGLFHPNRLCLDAMVYIIEPQSRIVYHIYDDRGMDLVSPDREALRPFYHQFSDWILDYDREAIDQVFLGSDD